MQEARGSALRKSRPPDRQGGRIVRLKRLDACTDMEESATARGAKPVRQEGPEGRSCSWNQACTLNPDRGCASGPQRADVHDGYNNIVFEDLVWALLNHSKTRIHKDKAAVG